MPDLSFHIAGAELVPFAAVPQLAFKLSITDAEPTTQIHSVALRCQIQIEATRRRYSAAEQKSVLELFGEPDRWSQTLRSLLWTHANTVVPGFHVHTVVDLPVPCTFDFNAAATKYFYGMEDGEIPLCFQFSGTIFYLPADLGLQVAPISWDREARFRLPVNVWREMMNRYYPNSAWLCLRRDVVERLQQYKIRHGFTSWEQALEEALAVEEPVGR